MPHPNPERRTNAPPGSERLLAGLTPEQAQAVTHGNGPLLLIAGPGAGKTRTLTHLIAHLLESEQARGVSELYRRRLERLVGPARPAALGLAGHHIVGSAAPCS